jgi:hypothetical protein
MPEPSLTHLVADSLVALRRETPDAYRRLGRALGARTARFRIGVDCFVVHCAGREVGLGRPAPAAAAAAAAAAEVEVETTWAAIVDIVEGRCTLLDALLDGRVFARGAPEDVAAVYDGMMEYVCGAVTGRSFPGMWGELRRAAEARPAAQRA